MDAPVDVLVVDDEEGIRWSLGSLLEEQGYAVRRAGGSAEAARLIEERPPEIALIDLHLGDGSGMDVLRRLREVSPTSVGIIVTGQGSVRAAVDAMRNGAFEFVEKPASADRLFPVLDRARLHARPRREPTERRSELRELGQTPLLGSAPAMNEVKRAIAQVAGAGATTVLILGESGTGKELVARAIHHGSPRRKGRFVAVNCAAISESLLEAELFGYEKGAFTGAAAQGRIGLFEAANKGTIFLDEIGEMAQALQAKLLRVLQERTVRRVGGLDDQKIDVRVVASTNRDLEREVKDGRFRLDLYYRLNVMPIRMPPLRERVDDIPLLAEYFLAEFSREFGKDLRGFTRDAVAAFQEYAYPGNVRELRNLIEHAAIVAPGPEIDRHHLTIERRAGAAPLGPAAVPEFAAPAGGPVAPAAAPLGAAPPAPGATATLPKGVISLTLPDEKIDTAVKELVLRVLERAKGNRRRAAARLGINRSTLYLKLKEYGVTAAEREESLAQRGTEEEEEEDEEEEEEDEE